MEIDANTSDSTMQQELSEARRTIQQFLEQQSKDQNEIKKWKEIAQKQHEENKSLKTEINEIKIFNNCQKENLVRAHIAEVECLRSVIYDKSQKVIQLQAEHEKLKEKVRKAVPALLKFEKKFEKNEAKVKKFKKTEIDLLKKAIHFGEKCVGLSDSVEKCMKLILKVNNEKKRLEEKMNNLKASQESPQVFPKKKLEEQNDDMEKSEGTAEEIGIGEEIDVDTDEETLEL